MRCLALLGFMSMAPAAALAQAQNPCGGPAPAEPLTVARPVAGSIIREFGQTWDDTAKGKTAHDGIDLEVPPGEPVYAALGGKVVEAGPQGALGNVVRIDHGGGLVTGYGHLARIGVAVGACLNGGEAIGLGGNTGQAPGPQLHFELRRGGKAEDPAPFLQ